MAWLRFFAALCIVTSCSGAASAAEWKVLAREGSVRAFADGEWTNLSVDEAPPIGALLQTETDGRLFVGRDADALGVAPLSQIRIEGDNPPSALVRLFGGSMGVAERDQPGKRFLIMTAQASLAVEGADFGVAVDAAGTTLSVRNGLVRATDLATRKTLDVRAGQIFRALRGRAGAVQTAVGADAASRAAKEAADRVSAATAGLAPGASGSTPAVEAEPGGGGASAVDPRTTGSLPGGHAKADPKLAEEAADAVHEQHRKAKLGKADPRAVAAAQRIASELFQEPDVETEPLNDDFKWTEVEDGEVRLKPIWRIVYGLSGAEAFEFWALSSLICLILGGIANSLLKDAGFGAILNAVVIILAFVTAALVRDAFFRAGANITLEPYLSMGMMLAAMPLLLLSGAFAKLRWGL